MCQNRASVPHVLREHVLAGLQDSHAVYSVDVQIVRIKDVKIRTRKGQHKLYLPCCVPYHALAVSLYNIIMSNKYIMNIFQLLYILILYYSMELNGKMGEPNTYLYENCRTTYRKVASCE